MHNCLGRGTPPARAPPRLAPAPKYPALFGSGTNLPRSREASSGSGSTRSSLGNVVPLRAELPGKRSPLCIEPLGNSPGAPSLRHHTQKAAWGLIRPTPSNASWTPGTRTGGSRTLRIVVRTTSPRMQCAVSLAAKAGPAIESFAVNLKQPRTWPRAGRLRAPGFAMRSPGWALGHAFKPSCCLRSCF